MIYHSQHDAVMSKYIFITLRIGHIKLSKSFNKVLTERKRKLILEFIAYIANFALQVRSFNTGKKEPFLFITIPKYLYSASFCVNLDFRAGKL